MENNKQVKNISDEGNVSVPEKTNNTQNFIDEYKALVLKYNLEWAAYPSFKLRDDGSYSIYVHFQIQPINKK